MFQRGFLTYINSSILSIIFAQIYFMKSHFCSHKQLLLYLISVSYAIFTSDLIIVSIMTYEESLLIRFRRPYYNLRIVDFAEWTVSLILVCLQGKLNCLRSSTEIFLFVYIVSLKKQTWKNTLDYVVISRETIYY